MVYPQQNDKRLTGSLNILPLGWDDANGVLRPIAVDPNGQVLTATAEGSEALTTSTVLASAAAGEVAARAGRSRLILVNNSGANVWYGSAGSVTNADGVLIAN